MNNNQFNSLPHSSNGGVGVSNSRNAHYHNNGPNNKNHKKKNNKKNYKNNNNNNNNNNNANNNSNNSNNMKNQPFNNYTNNQDFGHSSLPHKQMSNNNYNSNRYSPKQFNHQFNKFSENAPDLKSFGNNVPVPTQTKTNGNNRRHHRHRRGNNNNYNRGNGSFNNENDRLNKSMTKEITPDNSFSEIPTKMPNSISLDNLDLKTVSPKLTNSLSFQNSPSKRITDVIAEHEVVENSTHNFVSNLDSGVDSNSYCSMPTSESHKNYTPLTSELLSSIEVEEEPIKEVLKESSSSVSSSSQGSPNQNGYETAISQMASEAEVSFGYDTININNVENTITNFENIEISYNNQIDQAVLENCLQKHLDEEAKIEENIEMPSEVQVNDNDTTTSCVTDSSDNGSIKETEQTTSIHNAENTILVDQEKVSDMAIENLINKPAPCVEEEIVVENVNETPKETEIKTNIVAQIEDIENFNNEEDQEIFDHLKFAEREVNDLVNKIVHDVISQAIQISPGHLLSDQIPFTDLPNCMSLEQELKQLSMEETVETKIEQAEVKCIDDMEISFIDNDNSVLDAKTDTSTDAIEATKEPVVDSTSDILSKTEKILSSNSPVVERKSNSPVIAKEPPVDCFSCTIS